MILNFEDCLEKVVYSKKIQRKDFLNEGKYPIVSQEQEFINGYWNNDDDVFKIKKPVVIFGDHTQVLKYIDFDFVLGADGVKILQPQPNIDSRYLYFYLQSITLGSLGYARHFRLLKGIDVSFPKSISQQLRIVAILDKAFAAIAKDKANAEQNLKNARELFESCLQEVFEQCGEGWEEQTVEFLVQRNLLAKPLDGNHGEIHPHAKDYVSEGIPFIMACDLHEGRVDQKNCKFITPKQASGLRTGFSKNGDVLLSHKGTIGRTAILDTDLPFVVLTPQVTYYRSNDLNVIANRFLYYYFNSPAFQRELNDIAKGGSTRAYIGITRQLSLRIVLAPISQQHDIVQKLDALSAETKRLEAIYQQKIASLEELKKTILQKAFQGELNLERAVTV